MTALTAAQIKEIKVLVRLGDSFELALKTVLKDKQIDVDFYRNAYES